MICFHEHKRPTDDSISRINLHFGITLPLDLVQLAKHSRNYHAHFVSFGTDYDSPTHVVRVNSYWRRRRPRRRIPRNLVIITMGYMDDMFWCLDISAPTPAGNDYAMQFWCPDELTYPGERPIERYPDFRSYVEGHIKWR